MSDIQTSKEEKFFGVSYQVNEPDETKKPENSSPEIELEIVDDIPKRPFKAEDSQESDEELTGYSKKVRERINKLKYEQHEERRQREVAERMKEEALQFAQQVAQKNQAYENLIQRGEAALVQQIKSKAQIALEQAKFRYKDAYEKGDPEQIIAAQESLLNAQTEIREAEKYERNIQSRPKPLPQEQIVPNAQQAYQPVPLPQPSAKTMAWTKDNPWFGTNREMTALAYAVHETLVRDRGVKPDTEEYYDTINATMRQRFPDYFDNDDTSTSVNVQKPPSTVVAPSNRSNGSKPRKIQLSATQVSVAKRLGLTPEQYAKQLIKESYNG